MASGDTLFILDPRSYVPPATLYATLSTVADTSTPASSLPILQFDASTAWYAYWPVTVPANYAGGGLTWRWKGGTAADNTGTLILNLKFKPIADATILTGDLGIDGATASAGSDTPPATPINKLNYSADFTLAHADAGSPTAGDFAWVSINRDIADTNTGVLQLAKVEILET